MFTLKEAFISKFFLRVDDSRNNLQLLSRCLDKANYETEIASNDIKVIVIRPLALVGNFKVSTISIILQIAYFKLRLGIYKIIHARSLLLKLSSQI